MRGAEGVVHEDVAQRSHLAGEFLAVLLLALVQAAVLQHHHLAGGHVHTVHPTALEGHLAAQQFTQARSHRGQRVLRLELALGRAAQVRGNHHRSASLERHLDAGHRGADAGVFGDAAGVVLRHVQVSADEDALAGDPAGGHEIGKTEDVHGGSLEESGNCRNRGLRQACASPTQPQAQGQVHRHAGHDGAQDAALPEIPGQPGRRRP